jgi:hypothetical protein
VACREKEYEWDQDTLLIKRSFETLQGEEWAKRSSYTDALYHYEVSYSSRDANRQVGHLI